MKEPLNIQLVNRNTPADLGGEVWLRLPATAEQLQSALARINAQNGEQGRDFIISDRETAVYGLARELVQRTGIDELNYMAARLQTLDTHESEKLNALSHTDYAFTTVKQFIEYADNHDFFVYIPEAKNNAELGNYYLYKSQMVDMPEEWKGAVNVEALGALASASERGQFSEMGYILESGDVWHETYKGRESIPQEYRIAPLTENPNRLYDYEAVGANTSAVSAQKPTHASITPLNLTSENSRERLKEITDKLEQGIKGIFESEKYKSYLKTISKFHNYSMNNCVLIFMQKPDATYVAGYNAWRDNFKRQVMKGERGIKILAPSPYKVKRDMERIDPVTQRPVVGANGKPVTDEVEVTIPAFKVVTVFDISQTDGQPLPQIGVNELAGSVDKYKDFLSALQKASPVPIAFESITSGAKGFYDLAEKRIAINEGMGELQTLKTAIHEIAHARIHDIDKDVADNTLQIDRKTREIEAESIAYAVCQRYGLDTSDYSFAYVAGWSGNKQLDTLRASLDTIRKEAGAIINEIDKHFMDLQKSNEQTAEKPSPERQEGQSLKIAEAVELPVVAAYLQGLHDRIKDADPNKTMGVAAFNVVVKRLEQTNERIPADQTELKALITHAAQSPDIPSLKERMNTIHNDFIQHYAPTAQTEVNNSGKTTPSAVSAQHQNPALKDPHGGENVAAIEAKVKAGEVISLIALAGAIKTDKEMAQSAKQPSQAEKQPASHRKSETAQTKRKSPSIKEKIQAGKDEIAKSKAAPSRTAAKNKNAGLGD